MKNDKKAPARVAVKKTLLELPIPGLVLWIVFSVLNTVSGGGLVWGVGAFVGFVWVAVWAWRSGPFWLRRVKHRIQGAPERDVRFRAHAERVWQDLFFRLGLDKAPEEKLPAETTPWWWTAISRLWASVDSVSTSTIRGFRADPRGTVIIAQPRIGLSADGIAKRSREIADALYVDEVVVLPQTQPRLVELLCRYRDPLAGTKKYDFEGEQKARPNNVTVDDWLNEK